MGSGAIVDRERRLAMPVALATLGGVALLILSVVLISSVSGDGDAAILRAAHDHSSDITLSTILQSLGMALLIAPLVYLFRADQARSPKVRPLLIGVVVAAPLFLATSSVLNAAATNRAASNFVDGNVKPTLTLKAASAECRSDLKDDASSFHGKYGSGSGALAQCAKKKIADDTASSAVSDAPTQSAATGFGLAGRLGLAFALAYCSLWGMRVGLLTRFWGSLGIALGVAALLLLIQFTLIWFVYFGLLAAGWLPKGRPPAWAAGEAMPWPTAGQKAAEALSAGEDTPDDPLEPGGGQDLTSPEPGEGKRKRKQRS